MAIEQFIPEEETMNEKHTPGPWNHNVDAGCIEADGRMIADIGFVAVKAVANGNFIVQACNSHDALLEACKGLLMRIAIAAIDHDHIMPNEPEIIAAQAAIKLAEKEG